MRELDGSAEEHQRAAAAAHTEAQAGWVAPELSQGQFSEGYLPQDHEAQVPEEFTGVGKFLRRVVMALSVLVVLAMLVALPPLVNVSRYQRRIATSISTSLGRPVHFDSVTLNVLPMPGFTINRFVVSEDPAFGYEPVIRADTVQATLRMSSLWRRRVEFSKISLTDPSVNLVHLPDGRWNVESILLQASRMPAAPTVQKGPGGTQRFPYIEATGARVNLKMGTEKIPFALTDAEFALWLPEQDQWHLRLEAHPARTDTSVSDTGTLRMEGTLGRAASLNAVPIDLSGEWSAVPLGAVSLIALGRDAGLRGEMTASVNVKGTVGEHGLATRVRLSGLRRADFVPANTLSVDMSCTAVGTMVFRTLSAVRCAWPGGGGGVGAGLTLSGDLPDTRRLGSATGEVSVKDVPASALLEGLRVASERIPQELSLSGMVGGRLSRAEGAMSGAAVIKDATLAWGKSPLVRQDVSATVDEGRVVVAPVSLDLGGKEPALLSAVVDESGLEVGLRGTVFAGLVKALGVDGPVGVAGVVPVDLRMRRGWGAEQEWVTVAAPAAPKAKGKNVRKRR